MKKWLTKQFLGPRSCYPGQKSDKSFFFLMDDLKLNKVTRQETGFVYIKKQFRGPRYCPRGLKSDWIFFLTDDLKLNKVTRQETGYFAYYHVLSFQNGDVNKFPYRYLSCFNHRTQWGQIFSEISFLGILDFKICLLNHKKSRNITGQNISPIFKIKDKLKVYQISLLIMEVK